MNFEVTESIETLFKTYRPRLYVHALRVLGNTPAVQDMLQDTYITACTHVSSLRDPESLYPWLKKILLNNCFQYLRKEKSAMNYRRSITSDTFIEESIEKTIDRNSRSHLVYQALNHLSSELRSCILLRHFSKYNSYEEIALILGIPVGTVRSRLSAAREKLHNVLSNHNHDCDRAFKEANHWSNYYLHLWQNFYDDCRIRNEFINLMDKNVHIRYTSGKTTNGRCLLEKEFEIDMTCGSRYLVSDVYSSGNISILEGPNYNSPEHPDRCAPSSVIVLFRDSSNTISTCNVFDSPRN